MEGYLKLKVEHIAKDHLIDRFKRKNYKFSEEDLYTTMMKDVEFNDLDLSVPLRDENRSRHSIISIEGTIGAGKTTLIRELEKEIEEKKIEDWHLFEEKLDLLEKKDWYNKSPLEKAIRQGSTNIDKMLLKTAVDVSGIMRDMEVYESIEEANKKRKYGNVFLMERCGLGSSQWDLDVTPPGSDLYNIRKELVKHSIVPSGIIVIHTPISTALNNIINRARPGEDYTYEDLVQKTTHLIRLKLLCTLKRIPLFVWSTQHAHWIETCDFVTDRDYADVYEARLPKIKDIKEVLEKISTINKNSQKFDGTRRTPVGVDMTGHPYYWHAGFDITRPFQTSHVGPVFEEDVTLRFGYMDMESDDEWGKSDTGPQWGCDSDDDDN